MTDDGSTGRAVAGSPGALAVAVVVVAGLAVGAMAMTGSGQPTAEEVLTDARERYESAETVAGTAVVTVEAGNATRTAEVQFAVTDDNASRLAVTADDRIVVAGTNGSVAWVHLPEAGLTRVIDRPGGSTAANWTAAERRTRLREALQERSAELRERLDGRFAGNGTLNRTAGPIDGIELNESAWSELNESAWSESYGNRSYWNATSSWNASALRTLGWAWTPENATTERVGTETIGGTEAHVIELIPEGNRTGTLRHWIATESSTVLQTRFTTGNASVTVRYTDVSFNVSIADSTFRPPGAASPTTTTTTDSRDDLRAATNLALPRLPGEEYRFTTGSTVQYGDATAAIQRYAGPENATLVTTTAERLPVGPGSVESTDAATVELGNTTGRLVEAEGRVVVSWTRDGLRHAVIFEGPRETALALAESAVGTTGDP